MNKSPMEVIKGQKKLGLVAGYKPNRVSLYILMLSAGRYADLMELLYKDMAKYKIKEEEVKDKN